MLEQVLGIKKEGDSPIEVVATVDFQTDAGTDTVEVALISATSPEHRINLGKITQEQYGEFVTGIRKATATPSPGIGNPEMLKAEITLRNEGYKGSSGKIQKLLDLGVEGFESVDELISNVMEVNQRLDEMGIDPYKSPVFDATLNVLGVEGKAGVTSVSSWMNIHGHSTGLKNCSPKKDDVDLLVDAIINNSPLTLASEENVVVINLDTSEITPDTKEVREAVRSLVS